MSKPEIEYETLVHFARFGGVENERGGVEFPTAGHAQEALAAIEVKVAIPDAYRDRPAVVRQHGDGRVIVDVEKKESEPAPGWRRPNKRAKLWTKIFEARLGKESALPDFDDEIRNLKSVDRHIGWITKTPHGWIKTPASQVKMMLQARKLDRTTAESIMGDMGWHPWTLDYVPFGDFELEGRRINDGAQLAFTPIPGPHPHYDMIYDHLGQSLTPALSKLPWAVQAGIKTGGDYLRAWSASVFQDPFCQSPYLFFFGPENCGKSSFHELLRFLVRDGRGVTDAYRALTSKSDFNGELLGCVFAYIDEKDLSDHPGAFAKIRQAVTGKTLPIRAMQRDTFEVPNTTHWIHCANKRSFLPVWSGDTRITAIEVPELPGTPIPKPLMEESLMAEGPAFTHTLLKMPLPPVMDRLRIPVVATEAKEAIQDDNASEHAHKILEWFAGDITLGAKALIEAVKAPWPKDGRVIRRLVEEAHPFLKQHGIRVEIDHDHDLGLQYTFKRSA